MREEVESNWITYTLNPELDDCAKHLNVGDSIKPEALQETVMWHDVDLIAEPSQMMLTGYFSGVHVETPVVLHVHLDVFKKSAVSLSHFSWHVIKLFLQSVTIIGALLSFYYMNLYVSWSYLKAYTGDFQTLEIRSYNGT